MGLFFARKQNEDKNVLEKGEINRDRMKYWAGVLEMCFSSPLAEECGFHRQKAFVNKNLGARANILSVQFRATNRERGRAPEFGKLQTLVSPISEVFGF